MKRESIRVVWSKFEIKQEVILYLGTYPLPQSDLIFRNGGSIMKGTWKRDKVGLKLNSKTKQLHLDTNAVH